MVEIWVAVVGAFAVVISSVITALVTTGRARREREAQAERDRLERERQAEKDRLERERQVEEITAAAHRAIYAGYSDLLDETRNTAQVAREEARAAREAARLAAERADKAEQRAYDAHYQLQLMERLLTDLRPLIEAHVPGAEMWLGQLDRVKAMARQP